MITINKVTYSNSIMGRYVVDLSFTRCRLVQGRWQVYTTEYLYYTNDSSLFDELRHDELSKKRYRELAGFCRSRAQRVRYHNKTEFQHKD